MIETCLGLIEFLYRIFTGNFGILKGAGVGGSCLGILFYFLSFRAYGCFFLSTQCVLLLDYYGFRRVVVLSY